MKNNKAESELLSKLFVVTALISAIQSGAIAQEIEFDIERQPTNGTLLELAETAGIQIAFAAERAKQSTSSEIIGAYSVEQALHEALEGTGLDYRFANADFVVVTENGVIDVQPALARSADAAGFTQLARLQAALQADRFGEQEVGAHAGNGKKSEEPDAVIDEIVVTGTNIRGVAPESSPTRVFDRGDIAITGAATAQEFLETLTVNFAGGSNPDIPAGTTNIGSPGSNAGSFGSFGSSVNLRGLGSGSTLVLLNGRRIAPSSVNGDFTDLSMIPASAIERIETLTDGASSLYGSDAVAGVVNIILRDDFEGVEVSGRYGTGTQESTPEQVRAGLTAGQSWDAGNALIVFEYFDQGELELSDRPFAAQQFTPSFLLPSQKRLSFFGSVKQEFSPSFTVFADALFSSRETEQLRTDFRDNSFRQNVDAENLNVSTGGTWDFGNYWFSDFSMTYSEVLFENQSSILTDRLRTTDSDIWTVDLIVSGPILSWPAGDVRVAFGGHYRSESLVQDVTQNPGDEPEVERSADRDVVAVLGEVFVPLVSPDQGIAGINRLELSASGRWEEYSDFGSTTNPKIGLLWAPTASLSVRGSYSTSYRAPVLGRVGARDAGASALNTSLINSFFGLTPADPSLDNVVVISVAGTDSELDPETSEAFTAGFDYDKSWGRNSVEVSATYFDIDFEDRIGTVPIPGEQPINFNAVNIAFTNPEVFPPGTVIFNPSLEQISDLIASLPDGISAPFGDDPFEAVAINLVGVVRNLARTDIEGFDFDALFSRDVGQGTIQTGVELTYLSEFAVQASSANELVNRVSSLFFPIDLNVRGRLGYSTENMAANLFLNYADSYSIDNAPDSEPIDSWTTVDLTAAYSFAEQENALLNNLTVRASVTNLFDQDPPSTTTPNTVSVDGFDPANASPLGRFVALEVVKRF